MVLMFSVAVLPTRKKESHSYFNCGRRAAQFHPVVVIAVYSFECARSNIN